MYFVSLFLSESSSVNEIMWKNIVDLDRSQMNIWSMYIACWMPKATKTFSGDVIFIAIPLQQLLHERSSMLYYAYMACLFRISYI